MKWRLANEVIRLHTLAYRLTRGLVGSRIPGGPPMLLLDHVGAKSGTHRTTPLVYARDAGDLIIVASKGGHPKHPAWYHNLRANPDTTVQVGTEHRAVRARIATADERPRLWRKVVDTYGGYEGYRKRTDREIPLVVLEPRAR